MAFGGVHLFVIIAVVIVGVFNANAVRASTLTKYVFSASEIAATGARCLDGTGSGFYFGNATTADSANKWLFYLEGGGYCVIQTKASWPNIQNCDSRVKTALGTSSVWPATKGRLDSAVASTFNQVGVPYCGGDLHSGTRTDAVDGKYAAGHLTIAAIIKKLKETTNFDAATEVLFGGGSAGGLGVYVNANYFKSQLSPKTTLRYMTNAGWFGSSAVPPFNPTYQGDQFQILYDQAKSYLDPSCLAVNTARPWDCFVGAFIFPHLTSPLFVANSIFDTNQLVLQSGVDSNPNNHWADPYANAYIIKVGQFQNDTLKQVYDKPDSGMYITSDWVHGVDSSKFNNLLVNWYAGTKPDKFMDSRGTPNGDTLPVPPKSQPVIKAASKV